MCHFGTLSGAISTPIYMNYPKSQDFLFWHKFCYLIYMQERSNMKTAQTYEVKMLDGTRYKGKIAYQDEKVVVLNLLSNQTSHKLRLYNHDIVSIRELDRKKSYLLNQLS